MSGLVTRESILSAMYVRASLFPCFVGPMFIVVSFFVVAEQRDKNYM